MSRRRRYGRRYNKRVRRGNRHQSYRVGHAKRLRRYGVSRGGIRL